MTIKPHLKPSLIKNITKPSIKKEEDNNHLVISLKYLDKNQGQTFEDWEKNKILAHSLETLAGYCKDTLQNQCRTDSFKTYKSFPPKEKTDFYFPSHIPEDAEWASMHIKGKQCLAGHIFRNVFYIVFLDKDHRFFITEKKNT